MKGAIGGGAFVFPAAGSKRVRGSEVRQDQPRRQAERERQLARERRRVAIGEHRADRAAREKEDTQARGSDASGSTARRRPPRCRRSGARACRRAAAPIKIGMPRAPDGRAREAFRPSVAARGASQGESDEDQREREHAGVEDGVIRREECFDRNVPVRPGVEKEAARRSRRRRCRPRNRARGFAGPPFSHCRGLTRQCDRRAFGREQGRRTSPYDHQRASSHRRVLVAVLLAGCGSRVPSARKRHHRQRGDADAAGRANDARRRKSWRCDSLRSTFAAATWSGIRDRYQRR